MTLAGASSLQQLSEKAAVIVGGEQVLACVLPAISMRQPVTPSSTDNHPGIISPSTQPIIAFRRKLAGSGGWTS